MPLASVLVPVFNRADFVARSITSALSQTVADIEVVVVDNCSTDGTAAVVEELAAGDSRVRLFRNPENVGPVRNWIACAEKATSPVSKILFSDDLMHPNYLEKTLPALNDPECALVYTPVCIGATDWSGYVMYANFRTDCRITRDAFLRLSVSLDHFTPVSPAAALFRTQDVLRNIRTHLPGVTIHDFSQTGAGVDWLLFQLTALAYRYVSYVAEPLAFFREHPGSISYGGKVAKAYLLAKNWLKANVDGL